MEKLLLRTPASTPCRPEFRSQPPGQHTWWRFPPRGSLFDSWAPSFMSTCCVPGSRVGPGSLGHHQIWSLGLSCSQLRSLGSSHPSVCRTEHYLYSCSSQLWTSIVLIVLKLYTSLALGLIALGLYIYFSRYFSRAFGGSIALLTL